LTTKHSGRQSFACGPQIVVQSLLTWPLVPVAPHRGAKVGPGERTRCLKAKVADNFGYSRTLRGNHKSCYLDTTQNQSSDNWLWVWIGPCLLVLVEISGGFTFQDLDANHICNHLEDGTDKEGFQETSGELAPVVRISHLRFAGMGYTTYGDYLLAQCKANERAQGHRTTWEAKRELSGQKAA